MTIILFKYGYLFIKPALRHKLLNFGNLKAVFETELSQRRY